MQSQLYAKLRRRRGPSLVMPTEDVPPQTATPLPVANDLVPAGQARDDTVINAIASMRSPPQQRHSGPTSRRCVKMRFCAKQRTPERHHTDMIRRTKVRPLARPRDILLESATKPAGVAQW